MICQLKFSWSLLSKRPRLISTMEYPIYRNLFNVWSLIFMTDMFVSVTARGSCAGRCYQAYNRSDECHCNSACVDYHTCCPDFFPACARWSCDGRCFQPYNRSDECHCNAACVDYHTCCHDFSYRCTNKTSCAGRCMKKFNSSDECHCDAKCQSFNCCPGFIDDCGSHLPEKRMKEIGVIAGCAGGVVLVIALLVAVFCWRGWSVVKTPRQATLTNFECEDGKRRSVTSQKTSLDYSVKSTTSRSSTSSYRQRAPTLADIKVSSNPGYVMDMLQI